MIAPSVGKTRVVAGKVVRYVPYWDYRTFPPRLVEPPREQ